MNLSSKTKKAVTKNNGKKQSLNVGIAKTVFMAQLASVFCDGTKITELSDTPN